MAVCNPWELIALSIPKTRGHNSGIRSCFLTKIRFSCPALCERGNLSLSPLPVNSMIPGSASLPRVPLGIGARRVVLSCPKEQHPCSCIQSCLPQVASQGGLWLPCDSGVPSCSVTPLHRVAPLGYRLFLLLLGCVNTHTHTHNHTSVMFTHIAPCPPFLSLVICFSARNLGSCGSF